VVGAKIRGDALRTLGGNGGKNPMIYRNLRDRGLLRSTEVERKCGGGNNPTPRGEEKNIRYGR